MKTTFKDKVTGSNPVRGTSLNSKLIDKSCLLFHNFCMDKFELTENDLRLIDIATEEFNKKLQHDWHGVSAAITTGFVLESEVSSLTVCAEAIAIGKTLDILVDDPIECIVAVRKRDEADRKVIPPCGRCREFINNYAPDALVIIYDQTTNELFKVTAQSLLPFRYNSKD